MRSGRVDRPDHVGDDRIRHLVGQRRVIVLAMMTLRQIEVIRAVMISGTITGAAKLLNVSAPGISRLVKYTERSLGVRFFLRQNGRYFPTPGRPAHLRADQHHLQEGRRSRRRHRQDRPRPAFRAADRIGAEHCPGHGAARRGEDPPALPRPEDGHQHPQARGGDRLSPARQGRLRRHQLPAGSSGAGFLAARFRPLVLHRAGRPRAGAAQADIGCRNDAISPDRNRSGPIPMAASCRNSLRETNCHTTSRSAPASATPSARWCRPASGSPSSTSSRWRMAAFPASGCWRLPEPTRFETYVAVKRGAALSPYATHFIKILRAEMEADGKRLAARSRR